MNPWRPIKTAKKHGIGTKVDLWLDVPASPRSFGYADAFRVPDCWFDKEKGGWVHYYKNEVALLEADFITHWMPIPKRPRT